MLPSARAAQMAPSLREHDRPQSSAHQPSVHDAAHALASNAPQTDGVYVPSSSKASHATSCAAGAASVAVASRDAASNAVASRDPKPPASGKRALSAPHGAPARRHSAGALEIRLELGRPVAAKDPGPRRFDPMVGGGSFIDPRFFDSLLGSPCHAESKGGGGGAESKGGDSSDDDDDDEVDALPAWSRVHRRHTVDMPDLASWSWPDGADAKPDAAYRPQRTPL
ncbi:hypothetical protein JL720_8008 [Aureococcus anophagefferens]|nr:hypothetical protein JL720_8008 [Aureococcus anophagefferens]